MTAKPHTRSKERIAIVLRGLVDHWGLRQKAVAKSRKEEHRIAAAYHPAENLPGSIQFLLAEVPVGEPRSRRWKQQPKKIQE